MEESHKSKCSVSKSDVNSYLNSQEENDSMNSKDVTCVDDYSVKSENDNTPKTGATGPSTDSKDVNDIVLIDKQVITNIQSIGSEVCEGASAQKSVENGLHNVEVQSPSNVAGIECSATSKESHIDSVEVDYQASAVQHTDSSSTPWECNSASFSETRVFTCRRDSSSDSVDSESSSSSSSSSSDWDSSSDTALVSDEDSVRQAPSMLCAKPKRVVMPTMKTKGELTLDDLPPIEDLHISLPEHECKELGKVVSIVDKLVVVEPHRDLPTLNLDSVLFLDNGKRAMGHVFDVFGQVKEPLYCVRFNSVDHIRDSGILVGTKVYCAPDTPYTNYVFINQLMGLRGSDASWEQDNEPPSSIVYFSDDEEEREARRKSQHEKSKLRTRDGADGSPATQEPKPKRLNLMEERNNRRNLLLNATYSGATQHGRRQARGRGWVAPSPDDFIIKPSTLSFTTDWQPPPQDGQSESKPKLQPPSATCMASSPLFGICRPPQFPFSSARFSVPPPLAAGNSLFGVLRSQAPEMLTFVQPPPSSQPPVRSFVASGGLQFSATHHPPSIMLASARQSVSTAVQPRSFNSPVTHISFRPMQHPPSVLTSPPPPIGISFNVMQHPPDVSNGRLAPNSVCRPFRPQNHMSGMVTQQREFLDSPTPKPVVFDPSLPPPNLPCGNPSICETSSSSSHSRTFSPVSRVLLGSVPNPSTTSARGASCQQLGCTNLSFNPTQRPPGPQQLSPRSQQPSPPVFRAPWLREPWHTSSPPPHSTGVWQASGTTARPPGDVWQPRDIWQPQASGTPVRTSWPVPSSPWRLPNTPQQPVGALPNPAWQSCDQSLGPGRPSLMQFDVLRLRSPPPSQASSESSFYR